MIKITYPHKALLKFPKIFPKNSALKKGLPFHTLFCYSPKMTTEFKAFSKIERFKGLPITVTEKIHGTNAQIVVKQFNGHLVVEAVGSRTRYLSLADDNFGFARFVSGNASAIAEFLGEGTHYGEWVGPGINSDYGLPSKVFVPFDYRRHPVEKFVNAPVGLRPLPVLYTGFYSDDVIASVMSELKLGSKFSPGFSRPEGMVINFHGFDYRTKMVFDPEETQWNAPRTKAAKDDEKVDLLEIARPFLQPIRLEKLLMRDEKLVLYYPASLKEIVKAYIEDLMSETDLLIPQLEAVKKCAYSFVKSEVQTFTKIPF